jgi:ubiquinone/menaquinone biosynthesis C-methylase UbiE
MPSSGRSAAPDLRGNAAHPVFARLYAPVRRILDRAGFAARRQRLLAELGGVVVEVGAGDGGNFAHYRAAVTQVVAVEPEPRLRAAAGSAGSRAPVPVVVVAGVAEHLPIGDARADAVVFTLVLCSVNQLDRAVDEAFRVLRPGGRLVLAEHVRAPGRGWARVQDVLDATIWPRISGGCHLGRDPRAALVRGGFEIVSEEPYRLPRRASPVSFHVSLTARKP